MRAHILVAVITLIPFAPVVAQPPSSADDRAVRSVVQQIADSAHGQSASAREALFADDAQIINAFGNRAQGRKEIDIFWESIFNTGMFRTTKNEEKSLSVRFLTPKLALVDRFYEFTGQRGPKSGRLLPPRDIHMTLVLRKGPAAWRIVYYSVADLRNLDREKAAADAK